MMRTNWQSYIKIAVAGLLLSGIITLEATDRVDKGTAAATIPVVVTILQTEKKSDNSDE